MKKLLLLVLLCPFMAMAKFHPGTITFNDGTTKTGLTDFGSYDSGKVKFKSDKKAKQVTFSIDEVQELKIEFEENVVSTYIPIRLAKQKFLKKGFNMDEEKSWARIEREGEVNLYTIFAVGGGMRGYVYFINKEGDDHCKELGAIYEQGINVFNALKTVAVYIFEDCPGYKDALQKEDFKQRGMFIFAEKYEELCGKDKKI
ncbi:hypothetical protein ACX0HA_04720 [Flavobacterium hauense]